MYIYVGPCWCMYIKTVKAQKQELDGTSTRTCTLAK